MKKSTPKNWDTIKKVTTLLSLTLSILWSHHFALAEVSFKTNIERVCPPTSSGCWGCGGGGCSVLSRTVSITNVTGGQPIEGLVVFTGTSPVQIGQEATKGLALLSQEGKSQTFVDDVRYLNGHPFFELAVYVGEGTLAPGETVRLTVRGGDNATLNVIGKLAKTNDAFIHFTSENFLAYRNRPPAAAPVYDSGTEMNTELCEHIPAPPCNNPGIGTDGGEGHVHSHSGYFNIGDLDPATSAFNPSSAALISID